MIALPSIAFGGFSGSAKGVTARQVGGRSILSLKCYPTGVTTGAQLARRASLKKISKSWVALTNEQRSEWDRLAEHATGASSLGQKAELSGMNLYVRLNANRVMAGETIVADAPMGQVAVPNVSYESVIVTPQLVIFGGIKHESAPFKLVVKMSGSQSSGITNGWSKTVIISSDTEDDWGEADLTKLYLKTIGVEPTPGQKVFIESYWLDTSTGFTGQVFKDSVIVTGESSYQGRRRVTMDNLDPAEEQHVSSLDMDYSTNAPVIYFDTVCLPSALATAMSLPLRPSLTRNSLRNLSAFPMHLPVVWVKMVPCIRSLTRSSQWYGARKPNSISCTGAASISSQPRFSGRESFTPSNL